MDPTSFSPAKRARTRRGFTQEALAKKAKVSKAAVVRLELRGPLVLHVATVAKIAKALGLTVDEMLHE